MGWVTLAELQRYCDFLPDRKVFCIDGDGATLMHMGSLAINAEQTNLVHILINNCVHDSVGGQPTKGDSLSFSKIAKAFGYSFVLRWII